MSTNYSIDPSLYGEPSLLHDNNTTHEPAQLTPPESAPQLDTLHVPQQSDVDHLLRKKRKAREHKACYPCRQRKVKCDLTRPCKTCRDREHPELCDYNPPHKRQAVDQSGLRIEDALLQGGTVTLARSEFDLLCQKLNGLEESITELRRELGQGPRAIDPALAGAVNDMSQPVHNHAGVHGIHQTNAAGFVTHFGAGSLPTMLHALKHPDDGPTQRELREQLNNSIMPLFGLDGDSATYPFIDLWGMPHGSRARISELAKVLPNDQQTLAIVRDYKSIAYLVFPGLTDLESFEKHLEEFLVNRAAQVGSEEAITEHSLFGKNYYWLGLLFAVLASGAQSSTMPRKQRELTSQVYLCCAMECCRITNFLSRSNAETIQTLLIVQNVLSNNMSANTAWALLGLTIRLAQGQGLHRPCPQLTPTVNSYKRSKIWWAIVWQDSVLSITYDRSGGEHLIGDKAMPKPMQYGDVGSYHTVMYKLAEVTLDIVRNRSLRPDLHGPPLSTTIDAFHQQIVNLRQSAAKYLQEARFCHSIEQSIEYWGLSLHSSFVLAELCRPALDPARGVEGHRQLCIQSLMATIDAWLGLRDTTAYARQSWGAIHRALSSSLLLAILGEHNTDAVVRGLLARFVASMHELVTDMEPAEVAGPLQRGIDALQKLNFLSDSGVPLSGGPGMKLIASMERPADSQETPSPHTILNSILWGAAGSTGAVPVTPMPW